MYTQIGNYCIFVQMQFLELEKTTMCTHLSVMKNKQHFNE